MSWLVRLRADWPGSFLRTRAGERGPRSVVQQTSGVKRD